MICCSLLRTYIVELFQLFLIRMLSSKPIIMKLLLLF